MDGLINGNTRVLDITVEDLENIISKVVAKEVEQRVQAITEEREEPSTMVYSQKEAAKMLGISPTTLIRYTRSGRLDDAIKWNGGRRYEYDIERCRELIYNHKV